MELKELVMLYRHWFWLLVIGIVVGLSSGFTVSRMQEPIYEASAKALVNRTRQPGSTDILSISDQQLVLTYLQLLKTQPILDAVGSKLGGKVDEENVRVDVIPDTQIIQIKIQDRDANQAAAIANELIEVLIEQNETLQAGRYTVYEQGLNSQIAQVQQQISALQSQIREIDQANVQQQLDLVNQQIIDLQDEIAALEKDIAAFPALLSTVDRASLTDKQSQLDQLRSLLYLYQQIQTNLIILGQPSQGTGFNDPQAAGLQATLTLYQELYLNLLNNLQNVRLARVQSTPTVTKIEEATVPQKPIRPIPVLYTALSGMVGLFVAAGSILLIDYFDDTLKSSQRTQGLLDIPVIGQITWMSRRNRANGGLYSGKQPSNVILNAFGSLRINVSRLMDQKPLKAILITSPGSGEGKTTISVNLASAFARSGKKVFLLDADFHHPQLHSRLGLENQRGLSNILNDRIKWQEVVRDFGDIKVITSGVHAPSIAALLESKRMSQLLENLHKKADVIIIDGPPLFIEDSLILASKVTGILLIVRQGDTLTSVVRAMIDQLKLIDANLLGIVLNGVPRGDAYYSKGYYRDTSIVRASETKPTSIKGQTARPLEVGLTEMEQDEIKPSGKRKDGGKPLQVKLEDAKQDATEPLVTGFADVEEYDTESPTAEPELVEEVKKIEAV